MMEDYEKCKVTIYGNKNEITEARRVLDGLDLTCREGEDRLLIQDAIDKHRVKADILYDGNTVWSHERVIRDFSRALKSGPRPIEEPPRLVWPGHTHEFVGSAEYDLTNYLYNFLHLTCGSIAHFNKDGWIGTYPTKAELCGFLRRNEFGTDVVSHQPGWATDMKRIAKDMLDTCQAEGYGGKTLDLSRFGHG